MTQGQPVTVGTTINVTGRELVVGETYLEVRLNHVQDAQSFYFQQQRVPYRLIRNVSRYPAPSARPTPGSGATDALQWLGEENTWVVLTGSGELLDIRFRDTVTSTLRQFVEVSPASNPHPVSPERPVALERLIVSVDNAQDAIDLIGPKLDPILDHR